MASSWIIPEHQTNKKDFNLLNEDISQFGNTKLTKIYFEDEELVVDAWAVLSRLYVASSER